MNTNIKWLMQARDANTDHVTLTYEQAYTLLAMIRRAQKLRKEYTTQTDIHIKNRHTGEAWVLTAGNKLIEDAMNEHIRQQREG